jgi:hypothetical protein
MKMENYDKVTTNEYGTIFYALKGKLHREDGPAVIYSDGDQFWYQNGKVHREDGPAVIYPNGVQYWYQNGLRHREDGPAVIYSNGDQLWYQNGKLHREDGPALIYANGNQLYYKFGVQLNSLNDNPIFLTKDSIYSLYYYNNKFYAGCRKFTKEEALNHWSNPRKDNEERAKLFLIAIRNFKE